MEEEGNQHSYLKALLKMGDLDIRRISRDYLSLRIGDYFKTVEKFVNRVPLVLEALTKIATLKAADYDFRNLNDVKQYLEDMGYSAKFITAVEEIFKAGKRGHSKFAADSAKEILYDFNEFCKRITALPDRDEITAKYKEQYLTDVLLLLDQKEAVRKMKILAVDDSPVTLKTITSVLGNDYDVFGVANPTTVEKFLKNVTPDLFLLDYKMPEISGFDLVPIIRSFAEHKTTPIIFLTAMGTPDYVSAALALGACDYIVKPFQGDSLREKVAKHIAKKRLT